MTEDDRDLARAMYELERLTDRLRERNAELEQFASVVAHDLKSPLSSIRGLAETLQARAEDLSEAEADMLGRIVRAADRMRALIDDLLVLARAGGGDLDLEQVDLAEVAADVISDLGESLDVAGGEVIVHELPTVEASPTLMRQLLLNLVGNSIKYRRPDAPPRVEIAAEPAPPPLYADPDGGWWRIAVRDNGRGFSQDDVDRLFVAFDRLGQVDVSGTGVGLPICKRIVERHGGDISAEGTPGAGAAFTILLPERQPER
ncbi:MAG: hypothetical protein KY469_07150 [Actinobacteria bacterium]|nr:hypothetical protein [Actinomycetota bacterium]